MRNGQRLVCTIRAASNREEPVARLLAGKSLAWRIFDVVGTCLGVAIIAFTLVTVTCALRDHNPSPQVRDFAAK
jgi:hypothetical protein